VAVRIRDPMKSVLLCLAGLLAVSAAGCRSRYDLTLSNSVSVTAYSRPKLVNGYYVFKDSKGQEARVFAGRVRSIEVR
jgi:hypothetical protein